MTEHDYDVNDLSIPARVMYEFLCEQVPELPPPDESDDDPNTCWLAWKQGDRLLTVTLSDQGYVFDQIWGRGEKQRHAEGRIAEADGKKVLRRLFNWLRHKPKPKHLTDSPDEAKARVALDDRSGGSTIERVALAIAAERRLVWQEVRTLAEQHGFRFCGAFIDMGDTGQFANAVLAAATTRGAAAHG